MSLQSSVREVQKLRGSKLHVGDDKGDMRNAGAIPSSPSGISTVIFGCKISLSLRKRIDPCEPTFKIIAMLHCSWE
jgi:hypothetical protein